MIIYDPLWETMRNKGITKYQLIYKHGISKYTLVRMSRGFPTSSRTIDDLCKIIDCNVEDIMKYVKDPSPVSE